MQIPSHNSLTCELAVAAIRRDSAAARSDVVLLRGKLVRLTSPVSNGFTLIELLVVIGIIGLLAGALLPVLSRVQLDAKRVQTKADIKALELGIGAYEGNYSRFPVKSTGASDLTFGYANGVAGVDMNSEVMIVLMDLNLGVNLNHALNPNQHTDFSPKQVSDTNSPGLSTIDHQLRDVWGHPFVITLDLDDNKRCRDAFYSTSISRIQAGQAQGYNGLVDDGSGHFELNAPLMIWSLGQDGKFDDSPTAKANAGANRDNILSWQ